MEKDKGEEKQPLYCPLCGEDVQEPLACRDCGAIICRKCGTPLERVDELGIG
jgi:primosomal protein N'